MAGCAIGRRLQRPLPGQHGNMQQVQHLRSYLDMREFCCRLGLDPQPSLTGHVSAISTNLWAMDPHRHLTAAFFYVPMLQLYKEDRLEALVSNSQGKGGITSASSYSEGYY